MDGARAFCARAQLRAFLSCAERELAVNEVNRGGRQRETFGLVKNTFLARGTTSQRWDSTRPRLR